MRIGTKQMIDSYKARQAPEPRGTQLEKERLEEHLRKTRRALLGDAESEAEESFAEILQKFENTSASSGPSSMH